MENLKHQNRWVCIVDNWTTFTPSCWDDHDTWPTYYITPTNPYDEPEEMEVEVLITWPAIWAQIAYAVILRRLTEQRSRSPPNSVISDA